MTTEEATLEVPKGVFSDRTIRLGIVGAGAVAEICHLPAVRFCPEIGTVSLADTNRSRAVELADRFEIAEVVADYRELPGRVDGVIVGVPNFLHAAVTNEFLKAGVGVLVEKPLAMNRLEAETTVATATATGTPLQVGLMYRFCSGARLVKQAVEEDWLGNLRSFSLEWGSVFDWPAASGSFYEKSHAGGGVFLDMGSHMLDLLAWWIGPPAELHEYRDDSLGGVEADCDVSLALKGRNGLVPGHVSLSRLRKLDNRARIVGERLTIEYDFAKRSQPRIRPTSETDQESSFVFQSDGESGRKGTDLYAAQLRSFARAVLTRGRPSVPAEESIPILELIDRCYEEKRVDSRPWLKVREGCRQDHEEG